MDHDQMCPATLGRYVSGTGFTSNECQCWLIRKVRADERERRPSWAELVAKARAATLADLRAKVEALGMYSTFGPDGSLDGSDVVLRSDVLDLIDGGDHHGNA